MRVVHCRLCRLPADTAAVFKLTGPGFLGQVFMIMEAPVAGGAALNYCREQSVAYHRRWTPCPKHAAV
jgi:hypothetical protein